MFRHKSRVHSNCIVWQVRGTTIVSHMSSRGSGDGCECESWSRNVAGTIEVVILIGENDSDVPADDQESRLSYLSDRDLCPHGIWGVTFVGVARAAQSPQQAFSSMAPELNHTSEMAQHSLPSGFTSREHTFPRDDGDRSTITHEFLGEPAERRSSLRGRTSPSVSGNHSGRPAKLVQLMTPLLGSNMYCGDKKRLTPTTVSLRALESCQDERYFEAWLGHTASAHLVRHNSHAAVATW